MIIPAASSWQLLLVQCQRIVRRPARTRRPDAGGTAPLSYFSLAGSLVSVLFLPAVLAPLAVILGVVALVLDRSPGKRAQWAAIDGIVIGTGVGIWVLMVETGLL
ncbi:hypothetical protein ACVGVM_10750 [Pseudonocardia bannensis]|uniref:DUF4190 domain-containing protein n=1 Tax=Pseudonocardia bannensis TaxID=630973 RepID=A0A848DMQ4_9PSEU|nr:hypothetical protein [Pseudonocardia bannensis]NMH93835.1 hypothetical protein [Pseudonocardia bannensis]